MAMLLFGFGLQLECCSRIFYPYKIFTPCSRRALTTVNCGAQLVHMRDRSVEASLAVLEKLNTWFMPSHYTVIEVKMCIIKEWGDMVTF